MVFTQTLLFSKNFTFHFFTLLFDMGRW